MVLDTNNNNNNNNYHPSYDGNRGFHISSDATLTVENLSKIFESAAGRVVALRRINFTVDKGEFVSIVGPSGSGKSTLLHILGGLDKPTFGKIFIGGIDIFSLNDKEIARMRNSLIGFIFQSLVNIFFDFSNSHFKKLRDFVTLQLPNGFPVKIRK